MLLSQPKSLVDQVDDVLGRLGAFLGFLLKSMENINDAGKLDCINGTVRVPGGGLDDLQHARTAETFQRLGIEMLAALLCLPQGIAHHLSHAFGETPESLQSAADPEE